jgi:predicted transcriptional regulator
MESITNLIKIKSTPKLRMSPEGDFFRYWVEFLRPIHELTKREMDVLAEFLKARYELSKVIIDSDTLDRVLMSEETKRNIRTSCGISAKHFQVIMSKFRKNGVVKNNKIHLNLIPTITDEGVGLLVHFSFKDEQHIKLGHH